MSPSQCQPCLIQSHSERVGVSLSVSAMFGSVSQREGGCLPHGLEQAPSLSVSHVWFSPTARGRVSPSQCQPRLVQSHGEREGGVHSP